MPKRKKKVREKGRRVGRGGRRRAAEKRARRAAPPSRRRTFKKKKAGRRRPRPKRARRVRRARSLKAGAVGKGNRIRDVAALVFARLAGEGHGPVLTGRACAAIHGGRSIRPSAIEFVIKDYSMDAVSAAMAKIGFKPSDSRSYVKRGCPFEVVLTPAPVVVGDDVVERTSRVKARGGGICLLSPTDCVRQRLSLFYKWGDRTAFEDALKVARRHRIDIELVRRWSGWEWASDRFEEFEKALAAGRH